MAKCCLVILRLPDNFVCRAIGMIVYGILQNNQTLIMINCLQAACNIYYIVTYMALSSDNVSVHNQPILVCS